MKFDCIIFDCDGLMFNTEYYARKTWEKVLQRHDLTVPDGFFEAITGGGINRFYKFVEDKPEIRELLPEFIQLRLPDTKQAILEHGNINKKGLVELLQFLSTQPIKVCVASSSPTDYVNWIISTIGYSFPFDAVIGGDKVEQAKPDPALFLKTAELMEVAPERCLVLEDSKNGHLAAYAAGMHRCFIPDLVEPDEKMQAIIEYRVDSLLDVIDLLSA